jgi:hypothetical protein
MANQACSGVGIAREVKRCGFLLGVKWMRIARRQSVESAKKREILSFKYPTTGGSNPKASPLLYAGDYTN